LIENEALNVILRPLCTLPETSVKSVPPLPEEAELSYPTSGTGAIVSGADELLAGISVRPGADGAGVDGAGIDGAVAAPDDWP